jgi:hypothetical protein
VKRYEYFQETAESITDDGWLSTLDKHGTQGWELSTIMVHDTYVMQTDKITKQALGDDGSQMQKIYIAIFRREY